MSVPMSVDESWGNPFVCTVDDLRTAGYCQTLAYLSDDTFFNQYVCSEGTGLVVSGVRVNDTTLE